MRPANPRCALSAILLCACSGEHRLSRDQYLREQPGDCLEAEACILAYNGALAAGDPCCFEVGGPNRCDVDVACNAASGEGCCLIYATANTLVGQACCLYADGRTPTSAGGVDIRDECAALLALPEAPPAAAYCEGIENGDPPSDPVVPAGDCLVELNAALVPEGGDRCCLREGGLSTCALDTACNELSGAGCCLFYATEHTAGGAGCCLYADGRTPATAAGEDRAVECEALLTADRTAELRDRLGRDCQLLDSPWMQRACIVDGRFTLHPAFGPELTRVPAGPGLRVALQPTPAWTPAPERVVDAGPEASVTAYAAPYRVEEDPCCAELAPDGQLAIRAALQQGWLLIELPAIQPGDQVAVLLDYERMLDAAGMGYAVRFYAD